MEERGTYKGEKHSMTNYEVIKTLTIKEMESFLADIYLNGFIDGMKITNASSLTNHGFTLKNISL